MRETRPSGSEEEFPEILSDSRFEPLNLFFFVSRSWIISCTIFQSGGSWGGARFYPSFLPLSQPPKK